MARPRGDLRQVRDDEHLPCLGHLVECLRHLQRDLAADSLVYLVEHDRRYGVVSRQHHLEGQHEARQLAPAGHLG